MLNRALAPRSPLLTSEFDYALPPELIAQEPAARRDEARLLAVRRAGREVEHLGFRDLPGLLRPGDLLVLNDSRVFPARLHGERVATGGRVEALFLFEEAPDQWMALTRSGGKIQIGERLALAGGRLRVRVRERRGAGGDLLEVEKDTDLVAFLEEHGEVPLPPYIQRPDGSHRSGDRERYQTVYARATGAVAAPTAGLHFTPEIFARLDERGVGRAFLTLHVGPGTFRPVKAECC